MGDSSGGGLKIVMFGLPAAGKSALLGALWQVSQSQEAVLGGKINDRSGGLAELHQRLYGNQPRETLQEIQAYPVMLEPTGDAKGSPVEAVLIDCDGRVAQEFLTQHRNLEGAKGDLARAILQADALVLAIDPTTGSAQLEKEFQLFCNFVKSLETVRSQRNEVPGLPIYLVLTKCDLLSKPTDAGSVWVQRIEEGKRKIDKRFQEFLERIPNRASLPFGKVDVHLWATAVKRPQLADRPARAQEPYGVAELFRQTLRSAHDFHEHREKSQGRLHLAVMGFLGIIAVMAAAAGLFFVTRPSVELTRLESEIREVLPPKSTSTERLREPLEQKLKKLEEIKNNPAFGKLPSPLQEEVVHAQKEIDAYMRLNKKFLEVVQDPKFAKDEDDLVKSEKSLDQWSLAPEYRDYIDAWQQTNLAKKEQQYRQGIKGLREAVKAEDAWLRGQIEEGKNLQQQGGLVIARKVTPKEREAWTTQVKEFVDRPARFKDTDRLPSAPMFTYGTVYRFRKIEQAREQLKETKESPLNLRKLAAQ